MGQTDAADAGQLVEISLAEDDGAGGQKIVYNLMQQDMKALRVVFRFAYATARPKSRLSGAEVFPAGVVTPAAPVGP